MGQYYKILNIDKEEGIHPHDFNDGLKLMEFGGSGKGAMAALAALLVTDKLQVGPWAGCRIVISGDYADKGRFVPAAYSSLNLYTYAAQDDEASEGEPSRGYRFLKEEVQAQVTGLGVPLVLRAQGYPDVPEFWDEGKVFDQPEDVLDVLDVAPQENLQAMVREMQTRLRVSPLDSGISWGEVLKVTLALNDESGKATAWHVVFHVSNKDTAKNVSCSLLFPATAADVRVFLRIAPKAAARITA